MPGGRRWWADLSEALPVDVLPRSNGEYVPSAPTGQQRLVMRLAEAETERWRRRMGISRREFVRTSAALAIGFWAVDALGSTRFGSYARGATGGSVDACDLEWAGRQGLETVGPLPGEVIFDVQSHHVDPDGLWRVTNPSMHAFFATVWPQARPGSGGGDADPIENLSRFHYLKELFLDSATAAAVLSAVPTAPDRDQPLPIAEAIETAQLVNRLAGSKRVLVHAFVMPNRGASAGREPRYLGAELDLMAERAEAHRDLIGGWKVYCPWGDVPYASGWTLDSPKIGHPFLERVLAVSRASGVPPVVAAHKGYALAGFDQRAASPSDVGPAAAAFPEVRFLVYHSGHDVDEGPQRPYAGDDNVPGGARTVDALVKSLRQHGLDGPANGGNSPNVWAELGSVWRDYMGDPSSAAHLLGKLIVHLGPKRVVWGTDSLWYGSPQPEIVALRRFDFSAEGKELYRLPHGVEGDVEDPQRRAPAPERTIRNAILGRNAALAYGLDLDARSRAITCDAVNALRDGYLVRAGTQRETRPLASLAASGPRTRRALLSLLRNRPWGP
ncbi:MAG: hypothetical protein ACRDY7_01785 [Acidimicrobiia bacterium]